MRAVRVTWAALVAAGMLTLAASIGIVAAEDGTVTITEKNERYAFTPGEITVTLGGSVTWTNDSDAPHTVDADDGTSFESEQFTEGQTFSHTFDVAGTFPYHCDIHDYMKGTVTVLEAGLTLPPTDTEGPLAPASGTPHLWQILLALGLLLLLTSWFLRTRPRATD
jgi:plastocyanin